MEKTRQPINKRWFIFVKITRHWRPKQAPDSSRRGFSKEAMLWSLQQRSFGIARTCDLAGAAGRFGLRPKPDGDIIARFDQAKAGFLNFLGQLRHVRRSPWNDEVVRIGQARMEFLQQ